MLFGVDRHRAHWAEAVLRHRLKQSQSNGLTARAHYGRRIHGSGDLHQHRESRRALSSTIARCSLSGKLAYKRGYGMQASKASSSWSGSSGSSFSLHPRAASAVRIRYVNSERTLYGRYQWMVSRSISSGLDEGRNRRHPARQRHHLIRYDPGYGSRLREHRSRRLLWHLNGR